MKKLFIFTTFLFFCFGISFTSYASYLPPVAPDTSMIPSFLQTVAQSQIATDTGYYSSYKPDYDTLNQIVNGRTIQGSMTEVYVDNSKFSDTMDDFVNSQGQYVSPSNTFTAFGSSDVGRYSYIADKNTGEILSYESSGSLQSTLQAGGESALPYPIWVIDQLDRLAAPTLSNYESTLELIEDAQFHNRHDIYDESQLTQSQKEFIDNNDFYMYVHSNNMGWDMYVSNGCSVNCVIPGNGTSFHGVVGSGSSQNTIVYCTAPNQVKFVNGNSSNRGFLKQQNVSYFGRTWSYVPAWFNSFNVLGSGGFVSYKSPTQAQFNEAISLNSKYITMQPVTVNNDNNNYYNYTYVTENPPQYHTTVNNNYAPSQPISPVNYPVNNTLTLNYPDNNTNNYINNIYNYYTTPNTDGGFAGSITDPILPENIPILSNLEYRFPFSIPFDLYKLAKGLSVTRETPYIDTIIVIPGVNYSWHIQYDLHEFDDVAELFRLLELILFIVALAVFSYDHFFGS